LDQTNKELRVRVRGGLRIVLVGILLIIAGGLQAQWGSGDDDSGAGAATAADSSGAGSGGSGGWGSGGSSESGSNESQAIKKKPYVRFIPPYDSLRELIFYEGIVEDEECETCTEDSLYMRAKRYLMKRYGKKEYKKFVVEEKANSLIYLKVKVPMVIQNGSNSKARNGDLDYVLFLRFKEARYKYQFGNFAHTLLPQGLNSTQVKTYHEYYMKVKRGYETTDKYLLAADREVKAIVDGLKASLKAPYVPDEEDW
jgi:hypothetical protein